MSARAFAIPQRGLSDRNCDYFTPSTRGRTGDLSRSSVTRVIQSQTEYVEADSETIESPWFSSTVDAIFRLTSLPPGWDSRSARCIERRTAERVIRVLASLLDVRTHRPSIVPTVNGGVQAEWHVNGLNIEIEFFPSGTAAVSVEDLRDGTEWEGDLYSEFAKLRPYLQHLQAV